LFVKQEQQDGEIDTLIRKPKNTKSREDGLTRLHPLLDK
jgi:hypothetical protein